MARKIRLYLGNCFIFQDEIEPKEQDEYKGDHPFAIFRIAKGIDMIQDYQIGEEAISFIKNEPLFAEECDFTVWDMDKKIAEFTGSFADAFAWLIQNRKEYVVEA